MCPALELPTAWFRQTDPESDISPEGRRMLRPVGAQRRHLTQPWGRGGGMWARRASWRW